MNGTAAIKQHMLIDSVDIGSIGFTGRICETDYHSFSFVNLESSRAVSYAGEPAAKSQLDVAKGMVVGFSAFADDADKHVAARQKAGMQLCSPCVALVSALSNQSRHGIILEAIVSTPFASHNLCRHHAVVMWLYIQLYSGVSGTTVFESQSLCLCLQMLAVIQHIMSLDRLKNSAAATRAGS